MYRNTRTRIYWVICQWFVLIYCCVLYNASECLEVVFADPLVLLILTAHIHRIPNPICHLYKFNVLYKKPHLEKSYYHVHGTIRSLYICGNHQTIHMCTSLFYDANTTMCSYHLARYSTSFYFHIFFFFSLLFKYNFFPSTLRIFIFNIIHH